ncbi:MAG: phosphate ABC transporter permease PstA [Pseudomonadales bacterium]
MLRARRSSLGAWFASGEPWIWLNAAAVGLSIVAVSGILLLLAVRGFAHFWPAQVALISYEDSLQRQQTVLGEIVDRERLPVSQYLESSGASPATLPDDLEQVERWLIKTGNRRVDPPEFRWVVAHKVNDIRYPESAVVLERMEWGNAYGYLRAVYQGGQPSSAGPEAWRDLQQRIARVRELRQQLAELERGQMQRINHQLERLRLERRGLLMRAPADAAAAQRPPETQRALDALAEAEAELQAQYQVAETQLRTLRASIERDSIRLETAGGEEIRLSLAEIVRAWRPNQLNWLDRLRHIFASLWLFLSENPREANTEGGVFPAIFGTVVMVLLMSLLVTPFGVLAAVYLREYARQGTFVRFVRIAVNNLAGVPSIVYGVFGLGFFVYFLGGNLDALFFPEALPSPTFGTPGLMWASLTLALLTVPVVIVSTEEGLTRIPRSLREGSLALGATKAETLFKVVLPVASPSILTGVILAVARAAGEVAPLMLVGVVKLAPALPVDGNFPYIHLERKFMHLGFHIYDVGFQSPNVEAARPLVFATALLLVVLIVVLNLAAIMLRNRLENRYRGVDG